MLLYLFLRAPVLLYHTTEIMVERSIRSDPTHFGQKVVRLSPKCFLMTSIQEQNSRVTRVTYIDRTSGLVVLMLSRRQTVSQSIN